MQQFLEPSQQNLLVKSHTDGSLKSMSRYDTVPKRRVIYKTLKGEIVDPPKQASSKVTSRIGTPVESVKSVPQSLSTIGSILDLVPYDDPIWLELIPPEIQQDPNFSLERLIAENQEYFVNLLGLALQERQQNKMQEVKFSLPSKKTTTYDKEFRNRANFEGNTPLNPKIYETSQPTLGMQLQSQYESSFKQPRLHSLESFKPPGYSKDNTQLSTLTSYQQDYFNWKPAQTERMGATRIISTGALPFIGRTSYQESFRQSVCEPSVPMKQRTLGPFSTGSNMIFKESLSKVHYPQHPQEGSTHHKKNSQFQGTNSYEGAFKTTSKLSYEHKSPEPMMQDRYWKQKLLQRIQEKKQQP